MTDTTPLDLDVIEARAEAATEGPWVIESARIWSGEPHPAKNELLMFRGTREWAPDAEFIAHARTDVPALVARVCELEAVIERLCGCAPDCAERITCPTVGGLGHFACGWCAVHDKPRHKCGCIVEEWATA